MRMSDSLKLETLRAGDREALLASRGYRRPGGAGRCGRSRPMASRPSTTRHWWMPVPGAACSPSPTRGDTLAGAAVVNGDTLELVIDPAQRGRGLGAALTAHMLDEDKVLVGRRKPHVSYLSRLLEPFQSDAPLAIPTQAWSHGNHSAAAVLAAKYHFEPVRTLLQLRLTLAAPYPETPTRYTIDSFVPGRDDEAWIALNAQAFAGHPEQGKITLDDLHARMAEPWFDADDFLVARGDDGTLVGYNWLKIESPDEPGEIYVIGVSPDAAGAGLGRALMQRGLNRLAARGCTEAALYTDDDNAAAVPLYRSLGFADHTIDVQYASR